MFFYSWEDTNPVFAHRSAKVQQRALVRAKFRVKIRSLADESRVIRHEERKAKRNKMFATLDSLRIHRIEKVRTESRATLIAYAIWRKKPIPEAKGSKAIDWSRVQQILRSLTGERSGWSDVGPGMAA